ncbi:multiple monosaccharide ABC transporter permease [Lactonifactor longoviformis]|uniref:multiple monosaccharide ABC transporter permease n=1 Tax=Lactonifactor longoviformis TaxID=341220 RepID=UPI0036F2E287
MNQGRKFHLDFKKYGMVIALVVITALFQWLTKGVLLAPMNISKLLMQNGYILILAIGMLPIILTGDIDLSVGSVVALVGAVTSKLLVGEARMPVALGIAIGLLVGILIGIWHGFWIAYVKVPAFIATLAGMLFFRGLTLVITQGKTIGPYPDAYQYIAQAYLPDVGGASQIHLTTILIGAALIVVFLITQLQKRRREISYGFAVSGSGVYTLKLVVMAGLIAFATYWFTRFKGAPVILLILGLLTFVYSFVTEKTVLGRHIYALGGNERATALSGIKTKRVKFMTFVNMGLLAAFAGIVYSARINCANPTAGDGFELDAIAACYIGGASASGGVGRISGAIVGGLVMGVLNNGMSIIGVGTDWQKSIKGLVLLAAVVFDIVNQTKKK